MTYRDFYEQLIKKYADEKRYHPWKNVQSSVSSKPCR